MFGMAGRGSGFICVRAEACLGYYSSGPMYFEKDLLVGLGWLASEPRSPPVSGFPVLRLPVLATGQLLTCALGVS